ncbi:MAG TPA: acyl-CoA dehydrogenase family protein [Solirubrobacteraceae bacterium]|jgi:alkylation response protein AidB-like acyl-CoA dehydrogenase|nr:acyl-CoA dehydrogenase family protein [Solirubrobacteraceae bacterium]
MPFAYDNDQRDFIETVTEFLRDQARRASADSRAQPELWGELLALDLPALLVPEELDGLGLSPVDMVAVLEAAGRFALPVPLAMTIGPFTAALVAADGDDGAARELLRKVLAGATGTLAPTHSCPDSPQGPAATVDGQRLSVARVIVPDADADFVAVPAVRAGTDELVLVAASPQELGVTARKGMDATTQVGTLEVVDHEIPGATLLTYDPQAVLPVAWIAAAAELVGLAVELLDRSVAYARDRVQFGQPIGHFQGVKHRLVDVHLLIERARSLTLYAALAVLETRPDMVRAGHRAKAAASEAATAAARAAVQVHGGAGITAEEAVSGLYLRARQKSMLLGGADEHYELARAS